MSKAITFKIIEAFVEAGFLEEAERLRGFAEKLESIDAEESIDAAEKIVAWCHPKAWGDLNMASRTNSFSDLRDWRNSLDELEEYSKKKIRHARRR